MHLFYKGSTRHAFLQGNWYQHLWDLDKQTQQLCLRYRLEHHRNLSLWGINDDPNGYATLTEWQTPGQS